ncbi:MAG TPA: hypothetical protein VM120_18055 [Bryobacteraceae bacterium]|nr:hypothetical protein [Bryobacteraceae bacterium]
MTCEQAGERTVDRWIRGLAEAERVELEQHCTDCAECRHEARSLGALWNGLGDLPLEEPGKNLRSGFYQMLDAYRLGMLERPARKPGARGSWWTQAMAAGVILVLGVSAGHFYAARNQEQKTIVQLSAEMRQMRQLVALSLLQQQSASERLRGVSYSVRMESAGEEVLGALLQTIKHDQNVNVRLAAVDALKQFSAKLPVRQGMRDAMLREDSPLVQIALIEWAVEAGDRGSRGILEKLEQQPDLHPAVKVRLAKALDRLQ